MLRINCVTVDCADRDVLARFWAAALGWEHTVDDDGDVGVEPAAGSPEHGRVPGLLFLQVADTKVVKNRLHLDLRPDDQAAEVERLISLGATRASIGQGPEVTWVVLADPEGNELCVLRSETP